MIAAGDLRHRVTYQTATEALDNFGQPIQTWSSGTEIWARVEPLSGRELEIARQQRADVSHVVTVRGDRAINPQGRFVWPNYGTTRTLNIAEPARDIEGDRHHLRIVCIEVVDVS